MRCGGNDEVCSDAKGQRGDSAKGCTCMCFDSLIQQSDESSGGDIHATEPAELTCIGVLSLYLDILNLFLSILRVVSPGFTLSAFCQLLALLVLWRWPVSRRATIKGYQPAVWTSEGSKAEKCAYMLMSAAQQPKQPLNATITLSLHSHS